MIAHQTLNVIMGKMAMDTVGASPSFRNFFLVLPGRRNHASGSPNVVIADLSAESSAIATGGMAGFPKLQRLYLAFSGRMPLTPVDDFRVHMTTSFCGIASYRHDSGWQVVNWGKPCLEVKELPKNVYGMLQPKNPDSGGFIWKFMFQTTEPDSIAIATCVAEKFDADFGGFFQAAKGAIFLRAANWCDDGDWRADNGNPIKAANDDEEEALRGRTRRFIPRNGLAIISARAFVADSRTVRNDEPVECCSSTARQTR
ncbi:MAG: hypothetical protein H6972_05730 [Gammaproteobacteria bacterium]|nr:hypothetical protein [Gammaproteobacteria bacterium]